MRLYIPIPDSSLYPLSDQNGAKTIPLGSDTYLYGLYKGVPLGVEYNHGNNILLTLLSLELSAHDSNAD